MFAKVLSASYLGVEGFPVIVEVDISPGLPAFDLVGLPNTAVREARKRVRSALKNSPYSFPLQRITVNLAPADIPKHGSCFDLPIALGILAAMDILSAKMLTDFACVGELSLDGKIQPVRGALVMALVARDMGLKGLILPKDNYAEAQAVQQIQLIPIEHLVDVVQFSNTGNFDKPFLPLAQKADQPGIDFSVIKGQHFARRGLEVAAAGGHNLLMVGPPGSGKTLLAKALAGILPPLNSDEALESTRIHSIAGLIGTQATLLTKPPFREVHHSITPAGLIGGGHFPLPGEISLAHRGVLFLDEMAEFRPDLLDLLRQPLETGQVAITRQGRCLTFPARFLLIGTANPCKCGYYGDHSNQCVCTQSEIRRYFKHISGPLLDRLDLHIQVASLSSQELFDRKHAELSALVRKRVLQVRELQHRRFQGTDILLNSQIPPDQIEQYCPLDDKGRTILTQAMDRLQLTARGCHQILKLARTLADLRGGETITSPDLAEAIQYRSFERMYG